jgi:hypothetical protein
MTLVADTSEPLVLADGTKIDPASGKVIKERGRQMIEVPSSTEAQKIIAKTRRSIAELPAPPQQMTPVALVAFYTLFGLSEQDISLALDGRLTVEQIERVRELDAYKEFMVTARENIIETSTNKVRDIFHRHAERAASTIVEMIDSDVDGLAFAASKDLLDRAGHRPADIVEHRHMMENALQIVITKKDASQEAPVLDLKPEEVTYENV